MDPFGASAALDNPHQFWAQLDDILDTPFEPPRRVPAQTLVDAKRTYVASVVAKFLHVCATWFDHHLASEANQDYCIHRLFSSTPFQQHDDDDGEVSMQQLAVDEVIRVMQTSTCIRVLLMSYHIVLQYGQAFPAMYKSIQADADAVSLVGVRAFLHRLVHQVWAGSYAAHAQAKFGFSVHHHQPHHQLDHQLDHQPSVQSTSQPIGGGGSSTASNHIAVQISLREKAVRMLYEVCRVQKLQPAHLKPFDESFIHHLFDLVEETRHHHDEHFNYRLIKLLVAINEQYMVSTLPPHSTAPTNQPRTNLVLSVLQQRLNASKTFGENLIFMLNRASSSDVDDVCMQLLVLKLLYLLFTTKHTACYFYTNDLRVLVDIFIRQLHDLPDETEALRHTYLRVLHPLLTNTQLCTYPYKRPHIRTLLHALLSHPHLRHISPTTKRLVHRCLRAEWCVELDRLDRTHTVASVEPIGGGEVHVKLMHAGVTTQIKQNTHSVQPTADSLAITTQEHVASPISFHTTPSPTSTHSAFDATPEPPVRSGSLSVPSTLRTRDNSVVSAQSPPCTPPRVESPALNVRRQNSPLSELSWSADAHADDAMSTSSSWHAHMLQHPTSASGKRTTSTDTGSATTSAAPRVASPLTSESTMQILNAGAKHIAQPSDSTVMAASTTTRRKPPQPPTQTRRAMLLSNSDLPFSPASSRAASPYNSCASSPNTQDAAQCAHVASKRARARRRPPPPPPAPPHTSHAANGNVSAPAQHDQHDQHDEHDEHDERGEDELASAQSFQIAERLRRGLRIR